MTKYNTKHDLRFDTSIKISKTLFKTKIKLLFCRRRYTNDTYEGYVSEIMYKVLDDKIYILKSKVW